MIYATETPYQYARVARSSRAACAGCQLNEGLAIHSLYRPGSYLTGGYWDDFLVLPFAVRSAPPRRIAILGDAAGTVARAYGHYFPSTRVDAVEIDGELTDDRPALLRPARSSPASVHRGRAARGSR